MNGVFVLSIFLKGIGAVLEVLLQVLITAKAGVSGYGDYAAWVNAADLLFWLCFSGLVKCNTFYLSGRSTSMAGFKRKYYGWYVLPVLLAAAGLGIWAGMPYVSAAAFITALEMAVMDRSSTLLAQGRPGVSLLGEYVLGRLTLLTGAALLGVWIPLTLPVLLALYAAQYGVVLLYFLLRRGHGEEPVRDVSERVSLKKWGAYQQADLMHAMVEQLPVVLEYACAGSFEAGVVSIVLLVKKLINFISGPTAKVFLPEFSRLYHAGDREGIRRCYGDIMRVQMLAVGPMAVLLLGYPRILLGILAKELVSYDGLFIGCALIFLLMAALGPCGGILQMTGNEKTDNRCRLAALGLMAGVMVLTRHQVYFVLYGLCVQVASEAVMKFICICRWMGKAPVTLGTCLSWWLPAAVAVAGSYIVGVQDSPVWMLVAVFLVGSIGVIRALRSRSGEAEADHSGIL